MLEVVLLYPSNLLKSKMLSYHKLHKVIYLLDHHTILPNLNNHRTILPNPNNHKQKWIPSNKWISSDFTASIGPHVVESFALYAQPKQKKKLTFYMFNVGLQPTLKIMF